MRFKAVLTQGGIRALTSFVNTLGKFGKTVQMVVGPQEVHLLMTNEQTGDDGPLVCVRLGKEVVFDRSNFVCQSKHLNLIAFEYELKLFERVLHGALTNQADQLEMKLSLRRVGNEVNENGTAATRPFLTFTSKGSDLNMVQDLPISKPFPSTEVDALIRIIRSESVCPFYVDLVNAMEPLQKSASVLKKLSSQTEFTLTMGGVVEVGFHVMHTNRVHQQFKRLEVISNPTTTTGDRQNNGGGPIEDRDTPESTSLMLSTKQFSRLLQANSGMVQQSVNKVLCGIHNSILHLLFMYDTTDVFLSVKLASSVNY